ncbi:hypothetical protein TNCV_4671181 [Trichonephila clavipes]|nr:hypothetical protein TNCV_4671181 [Trichonephila clavipes]
MNSPDIDDFIDMFSVPTPISPLPPTPVASPSHEPSQDAISKFITTHGIIYSSRVTFEGLASRVTVERSRGF